MRASILNGALYASSSVVLLAIACVSYIVFYNSYIPQTSRVLPVYFQHQPHALEAAVPIEETQDNSYEMKLSLRLPFNEYNQQLGNFMVSIHVDDQTITRPAIVPHESSLVATARTLFSLPFLLLGLMSESIEVIIPLYEGSLTSSTIALSVDKPLRVYSSVLMVNAQFNGLRYLIWNYRVTSFVVFSAVFWSVEMTMMTAVFLYLLHNGEAATESTLTSRTGSSIQLRPGKSSTAAKFPGDVKQRSNIKKEDPLGSFESPKMETTPSDEHLRTAREIKEEDTWD